MDLNEMRDKAHKNSVEHGFWEGEQNIPEKLMLIASEAFEALDEHRAGRLPADEWYWCPVCEDADMVRCEDGGIIIKPVGIPSELADILIRVGDFAGKYGIDLDAAVEEKMAYNATRPMKHGKIC